MSSRENDASRSAINHFRETLRDSTVRSINVSATENPDLFPFYEHIRFSFAEHWTGIVITDKQGVYTPIERYDNNVIHVMRLPKLNVPVYALTDLRSIVYTEYNGLMIVFQGVYQTAGKNWDFIDREYYIRPVPGISFEKHLLVLHILKVGKFEAPLGYDDSECDDDLD